MRQQDLPCWRTRGPVCSCSSSGAVGSPLPGPCTPKLTGLGVQHIVSRWGLSSLSSLLSPGPGNAALCKFTSDLAQWMFVSLLAEQQPLGCSHIVVVIEVLEL